MKACLFFDWTGTLVDEYELDKNICKNIEIEIAKKEGIKFEQASKKYVDLLDRYISSWKWYDYPLHGKIFNIDWKKVQIPLLPRLKIVPHTIEVLTYYQKKGYYICLLTNAVRKVIDLRINYLNLRKYFNLVITSDEVKSTKSTGKHIKHALKLIDTPKKNIYMIGDDLEQDIRPATRIGITSVLCEFGELAYLHNNNSNDRKEKQIKYDTADYIIYSLKDLFNIIK